MIYLLSGGEVGGTWIIVWIIWVCDKTVDKDFKIEEIGGLEDISKWPYDGGRVGEKII